MYKEESKTYLYKKWLEIKYNCNNYKSREYHLYGAKEIKLYKLWYDFQEFKDYCESTGYEEGKKIKRINKDKDFKPGNIYFVDKNRTKVLYLYKLWLDLKKKYSKNFYWNEFDDFKKDCILLGYQKGMGFKIFDKFKNIDFKNIYFIEKKYSKKNKKIYQTWYDMNNRCYNKYFRDYPSYGGRGIQVCDEWKYNPNNFLNWALKNNWENSLEIDRVDNNGNYCPENCWFTTRSRNNMNIRYGKKDSTSKYLGISWNKRDEIWVANINLNKKRIWHKSFNTEIKAVIARNEYIIENKLPHRLNVIDEQDAA